MKLCRTAQALKAETAAWRKKGLRIGFVPTMGALHDGHLELVRRARAENDRVVASIFVNPIQFGPREDFSRYPRPFARDRRLLEAARADLLFSPEASELYPEGFQTRVSVGAVAAPLCGRSRPVHFSGVATVVLKLLQLVAPDRLYLGQKDYQQVLVVRRMVRDLDVPVDVRMVPTVREPDGLAMSSRNVFLSAAERTEAAGIYRALKAVRARAREGVRDVAALRKELQKSLSGLKRGRIDYAEILDAETLSPMVKLTPNSRAVAACAVFYPKARLIDNILIGN
jgi:pantoate--beta-alanine ligase